MLVRLLTVNKKNCLNPKKSGNMRPHHSYSSRENVKPSGGTSTLVSYKEVAPPTSMIKDKKCERPTREGGFPFDFRTLEDRERGVGGGGVGRGGGGWGRK